MNKFIVCGFHHSLALKDDGTIYCWGHNKYNQCDEIYKLFTNVKK